MQNRYEKCPNCMQPLKQGEDVCPYCTFDVSGYEEKPSCLKPFTVLQDKYMIGRVIGVGGFGITYIGWDLNLETYIAIKEYYPDSYASRDTANSTMVIPSESKKEVYDKGLTRYVEEARNLSKFYQLQGIVSVKDFFYENGTAYIVMEYINGVNLKEYLKGMGGKLEENTVLTLMRPVLESLYQIHNYGLVHRDISPDNIMVDQEGKIKLIDFGSARGQSAETDKTYTVILKHGYAPPEQYYAKGKQGPWTDIYSLCATMYKMLTGEIPPNGVERMEEDTYLDPSARGVSVSKRTEMVLRKGLAVKAQDRYQHIGELLTDLYGDGPVQMANRMPQANPAGIPGQMSQSLSGQSMYLAPQPEKGTEKKSNKTPIIVAVAVAAVALVVGLVLILGKGRGSNRDTTEIAGSETTTEQPDETTEAISTSTETVATGSAYEWPTELSDTWRDYTANIDGTIYKFPLPYSEWKSKGWQTDDVLTTVASGDYEWVSCYNDRVSMTIFVANPGVVAAKADDCYVVGFSFDAKSDESKDGFSIELANGIKLYTSTEDDIKKAYGAPEYRNEGEYSDGSPYVSLDYAGDDIEDGMDFDISEQENLVSISMLNLDMPQDANAMSQISTEAPAINSKYQAPASGSTDRFDGIITIEGKNYVLPVPFSELEKDGWILDTATDEYISGESSTQTSMEKDGKKLDITLKNFTSDAIFPKFAYITEISAEDNYFDGSIIFPGGISLGSEEHLIADAYGDLGEDYSRDVDSSFISYYIFHNIEEYYIAISAFADPETGIVTDYSYSTYKEITE